MADLTLHQGPDFQRCVIKMMLLNSSFCSKATEHLKRDFFSGELSWFFGRVSTLYQEYKTPPTSSMMEVEIKKQVSDYAHYKRELDQILTAEPQNLEYMQKELTAFIQANLFVNNAKQSVTLYNEGNRAACYDLMKSAMTDIYRADFGNDKIVKFGDSEAIMEIARTQSRDAVPTGIHAIDEAMQGGMMPQTWTTFMGGSNVGKSMLMPNLAKAAYQKRKKTFVMVHEDEEVPTKLRYLACFSDIPYNRLLLPRQDLSAEELKIIKDADEILHEFVRMRFMYSKDAYIESVCDQARRMKEQWDYHLLGDDYLQCLKVKSFAQMDNTYSLYEFTTGEAKQLCCELNVAGVGGAQTNRLGHKIGRAGTDLIRCTDIGDSWGIVKKSSNVITMNRSETNIQTNTMVYLLDKVRNGRCPVAVSCYTDYGRCQTFKTWAETNDHQKEVSIGAAT